jgi:hypothetical protein
MPELTQSIMLRLVHLLSQLLQFLLQSLIIGIIIPLSHFLLKLSLFRSPSPCTLLCLVLQYLLLKFYSPENNKKIEFYNFSLG